MEALERILSQRRKSKIIENVILKISQYSTMLKFSWSRQARTTLDFFMILWEISISIKKLSGGQPTSRTGADGWSTNFRPNGRSNSSTPRTDSDGGPINFGRAKEEAGRRRAGEFVFLKDGKYNVTSTKFRFFGQHTVCCIQAKPCSQSYPWPYFWIFYLE